MERFLAAVAVALLLAPGLRQTSELAGRVLSAGVPGPGPTITATHADRTVVTASGDDGAFRLAGLDDGAWTLRVEMRGFATASREIVLPSTEPLTWTLTMRPYAEMGATSP